MNPVTKQHLIYVAKQLDELLEEAAFVGGAVLQTYLPKEFDDQIRVTYDLDIVIELSHYGKLEELNIKLANIGFYPDQESSVICRYTNGELLLDVMPTDSEILGFTNQWYKEGLENRECIKLDSEVKIPIFTLPYYLAAKWEAVKNRGKNDLRTSKDMEDIITLVNNNVLKRINNDTGDEVLQYLKNSFKELLENNYGREIILSHLSGIDRSNVDELYNNIKSFVETR